MELAYINRKIVRWARERRGLTKSGLASEMGISAQQMSDWESGTAHPPFGRAQSLARVLDIPFGYLFLGEPPVENPPIPDLRRVDPVHRALSPEFLDLLNDVIVKHDWYIAYAKKAGANRLPFVGRYSVQSPRDRVVSDMRSVIGHDVLRREANSWSDYLRLLAASAEGSGMLVMRAGVVRGNPHKKLSVSELRGFAISNPVAPLIFVNARDAIAAQIFTITHELVHVWLGQSGISNPDLADTQQPAASTDVIEQFCDEVAVELLAPRTEFEKAWNSVSGNNASRAESLARRFKVSVPVILRRAQELGHLSQTEFFRLWNGHQEKVRKLEKEKEEEGGSGGNFYNTFFARNSRKLTEAIVTHVRSGTIGTLDAARLLNVRTATIPKLAGRLTA